MVLCKQECVYLDNQLIWSSPDEEYEGTYDEYLAVKRKWKSLSRYGKYREMYGEDGESVGIEYSFPGPGYVVQYRRFMACTSE